MEEIIKHNKNINLKIIFTTINNENDKPAAAIVKHLLAIASKGDIVQTQQALDDWYLAEKRNYEVFKIKYPIYSSHDEQKFKLDTMRKWCNEAEITFTPTIFINGKQLPETYNINELKNIL